LLGTFVAEFEAPIIGFSIHSPLTRAINVPVQGIIDTGANRVCIPRKLASQARLREVGTIDLKTASHSVQGILFEALLDFDRLGFSQLTQVVSPVIDRSDVPILIGMSVLRQFNIWYHGGLGSWSFYRREDG
jgi:predicted aspartyl protease